MRLLVTLFLLASATLIGAQTTSGLVAYYSFEDCDAKDVSLNNSDGIVFGDPTCDCGVEGNALALDGVDDYVVLAGNVETYFEERMFTLSFYFRTTDNFGTHDILSKRSNCNFNRALAVRYSPSTRTLSVDLAESDTVRTSFFERLDPGLCWIHLVITKGRNNHSIYVNGEFLATLEVDDIMDLTSMAPLQFGNGPCIGSTDRRFQGLIDELRVYNRVLSPEEIGQLYLAPDRILTRDTTIFQGSSARLVSGVTCAPAVNWLPAAQTDPSNDLVTLATPPATQTYTLQYQYPSCTATDTVRVEVINPDEIECGNVPLPNAFTPNADGRNDEFFISNPFALEELEAFEIFDRWGNLVFATTDVAGKWDGNYRGREANPGVYMYKLRYTCQGQDLVKTGSIMLIR